MVSGPTMQGRVYAPDVLVTVIQMGIFIDGSTSYKTTPKILANSQHSLGLRARQHYTTLVPRLLVG